MYKCIPVVDAFIQISVSLWWPSTRSCRVWRWQRELSTLPLIAVFGECRHQSAQVGPCCLLALRMQPEEMRHILLGRPNQAQDPIDVCGIKTLFRGSVWSWLLGTS